MTQLKCPECGKEFDDTKQACPDCGCPASYCSHIKNEEEKSSSEKEIKQEDNNFTKSSLLPNEQIIVAAKWHWMKYLFPAIMLFVLSIALLIGSYYEGEKHKEEERSEVSDAMIKAMEDPALALAMAYSDEVKKTAEGTYRDIMQLVDELSPWHFFLKTTTGKLFILCVILVPILYFINKKLSKYDEFVITNLRVIAKVGVIRRIAFELRNEQVESIGIYQGIFGRIFGYGTLVPGGVGASKVLIRFVKDPFELRQHFYDLKCAENQNTNN